MEALNEHKGKEMSKIKTLLNVKLFEVSNNFIYNLSKDKYRRDKVWELLPKYTINTNDGAKNRPIITEYFLQFVGTHESAENEKYLLFDLETTDGILNEEIAQVGEDLFEDFDFKKLLSVFKPQPETDITKFNFPLSNYIVVELEYLNSGYEYYETELIVNIKGYLDSEMRFTYYDLLEDVEKFNL